MLRRLSFLASLLLLTVFAAQAQTVLTADQLQNGQAVELDKLGWKYSPDDDPRFADPQFDDRAWVTLATSARPEDSGSWRGLGWFRLHLRVAPELANVALNLEMAHLGASEVYVNGRLIRRFGVVGKTLANETGFNPNALPLGIVLQAGIPQVIAVRYSNQQAADLHSFLTWQLLQSGQNANGIADIGFYSRIREISASASRQAAGYGNWPFPFGYLAFEAAFFFAFAVLHLLLFAFFSRQRSNLFYGLVLLGVGLNDSFNIYYLWGHYGWPGYYLVMILMTLTTHLPPLALLAFLYLSFTDRLPRRMWFFVTLAVFVMFWWLVWPVRHWSVAGTIYDAVIVLEMIRLVVGALRRGMPGAKIVGAGTLLFTLTLAQQSLLTPSLLASATGSFGMILALSLYLARDYARTNEHLAEQLVQVKQLSAAALEHEKVKSENERRAAELEEARQLQLSMLPKKLPDLPHLDLAAKMKTATEVGGDYYDFHVSEDGTLTIAVGDATGHGLKAGTLVASVKSLFVSLAYHPDIPHIFERISVVLKAMKLRGLFMAMTMVKVNGHQMSVSIAGMPSVLIWRAQTGCVEEVVMRALPLGGLTKYQYRQQELTLAADDVVVLMSDGLPERFNAQGEMLDYERIRQTLPALAHQSSEAIIAELIRVGDEWSEGRPQDDDMTFVVLKIRSA